MSSQDLEMFEGEDKEIIFTHGGSSASTATEIKFCISRRATVAPIITKILGDGVTVDSATQYTVLLDSADTTQIGGRSYYFEVRMSNNTNLQDVVASGQINIRKSNTEDTDS